MQKSTDAGALDFILKNNKKFVSYDADEVYFFFYIPKRILSQDINGSIVSTKKFALYTKDGSDFSWDPLFNIRDRSFYKIPNEAGEDYFLIRGTVKLDIFSERKITILRIFGNFNRDEGFKVYYWFSTKHGVYPRYIELNNLPFIKEYDGDISDVLNGGLPFAVVNIREQK